MTTYINVYRVNLGSPNQVSKLQSSCPSFSVIEHNFCCTEIPPKIRFSKLPLRAALSLATQLNLEEADSMLIFKVERDYIHNQ